MVPFESTETLPLFLILPFSETLTEPSTFRFPFSEIVRVLSSETVNFLSSGTFMDTFSPSSLSPLICAFLSNVISVFSVAPFVSSNALSRKP